MRARVTAFAIAAFFAVGGCSLLVDFEDAPADGGVYADATFDAAIPDAGEIDVEVADEPDPDLCIGKPDGYNYNPADPYARCCDAGAVRTVTNDRCGTCAIKCNAAKGQKCTLTGPHYYCRGCVQSPDCWSGCCSTEFGAGLCAASNCVSGLCQPALCKDGTRCVVPGDASNYCEY
ncbi:MAG: hypothetical protein ABI461_06930 [Polyangiaceae bacterium]